MQSSNAFLNFDGLPRKTLLRPQEVATIMNVSSSTIYRWYEMGVIQGTRLNRTLRIFRESVIRQIEAQKNGYPLCMTIQE